MKQKKTKEIKERAIFVRVLTVVLIAAFINRSYAAGIVKAANNNEFK